MTIVADGGATRRSGLPSEYDDDDDDDDDDDGGGGNADDAACDDAEAAALPPTTTTTTRRRLDDDDMMTTTMMILTLYISYISHQGGYVYNPGWDDWDSLDPLSLSFYHLLRI